MTNIKLAYYCKLCNTKPYRYFQNIREHLAKKHQISRYELSKDTMKKYIKVKKTSKKSSIGKTLISHGTATEQQDNSNFAFPMETKGLYTYDYK